MMFSDFWNYLIFPTLISVGAFYIVYPEKGKNLTSFVLWKSVNLYSRAAIILENLIYPKENNEKEDITKDVATQLSYYNSENSTSIALGDDYTTIPVEWWEDVEKKISLLILKNINGIKEKYKVFKNYKELVNESNISTYSNAHIDDWTHVDKQFVQVELIQGNGKEVIDIHKYLDYFYIKGNSILGKTFLQWYLNHWYNIKLEENYTLKIFDKDVNLFSICPDSYIYIGECGYSVIAIDALQKGKEKTKEKKEERKCKVEEKLDEEESDEEDSDEEESDEDEEDEEESDDEEDYDDEEDGDMEDSDYEGGTDE